MRTLMIGLAVLGLLLAAPLRAGWEEGVSAFKAGNFQQAVTEFQEVTEAQPDYPGGHLMLGWALLKGNKPNQAIEPLRKAAELDSDDVQTKVVLGQALFKAKRYRETTQILGQLEASSLPKGTQAAVYQMRGTAHQAIGQLDRAVPDLKKAAELSDTAKAWYAYGSAAMSNADVRNAVQAFQQAVSKPGSDAKMSKAYVNALVVQGRQSRGSAKEQAYQKAVNVAQRLASSQPNYENLLLLGEVQLGAKMYTDAIATFKRAIGENARDWYAHFYLGQAYTVNKQFDQALPPLKTAIDMVENEKDRTRVWGQLAFVYEKQKDYEKAIDAYQKAGDPAGERRVRENWEIAQENRQIEEHNKRVEELEEEAKALEEELERLPGGAPPRR